MGKDSTTAECFRINTATSHHSFYITDNNFVIKDFILETIVLIVDYRTCFYISKHVESLNVYLSISNNYFAINNFDL